MGVDLALRSSYLQSKGALEYTPRNTRVFKPNPVSFQHDFDTTNRYGLSQATVLALGPLLTQMLHWPWPKSRRSKRDRLEFAIAKNAVLTRKAQWS